MFDGVPFSNSKAFSATSQRTFYGPQAMNSVEVLDTTCCAPACGVGELLATQLAIRVDNRDIEVASSAIRPQLQLNLDLHLCFLSAVSAFDRSRYPPWTQGHSVGTPIAAGARYGHPDGPFAVLGT